MGEWIVAREIILYRLCLQWHEPQSATADLFSQIIITIMREKRNQHSTLFKTVHSCFQDIPSNSLLLWISISQGTGTLTSTCFMQTQREPTRCRLVSFKSMEHNCIVLNFVCPNFSLKNTVYTMNKYIKGLMDYFSVWCLSMQCEPLRWEIVVELWIPFVRWTV